MFMHACIHLIKFEFPLISKPMNEFPFFKSKFSIFKTFFYYFDVTALKSQYALSCKTKKKQIKVCDKRRLKGVTDYVMNERYKYAQGIHSTRVVLITSDTIAWFVCLSLCLSSFFYSLMRHVMLYHACSCCMYVHTQTITITHQIEITQYFYYRRRLDQ